jgi:hypothetical protein
MTPADEQQQPWFDAALQLLDLRPQDRVLAIGCDTAQVRALASSVGRRGAITVACGDRSYADAIAGEAPQQVEVFAHATTGTERYGTFDALLVTAPWGPLLATERYADLATHNLRPGGRCVIDLPGPDMVPELVAAALDAGWSRERFAPLHGIADDELAPGLRKAGLRGVRVVLGAHLLHPGSPGELVERFAPPLDLDLAECVDLSRALVRRSGGTGPFDVLVHRTRVQAIR